MSELSPQELEEIAESYQQYLVPAMFEEASKHLVSHAGISQGQKVLDVACGTGVLARAAAKQVGEQGAVTGLDMNPGMIAVARQLAPEMEWRQGMAEELPFDNDSFDMALCQFSLMFFEDKQAAIQEMLRVLTAKGRLAISVFNSLDHIPAYRKLINIYVDFVDDDKQHFLSSPFQLGDTSELNALCRQSGLESAELSSHKMKTHWPDIRSLILADAKGWFPLAGISLSDDQLEEVNERTKSELSEYIGDDGSITFTMPYYIITN